MLNRILIWSSAVILVFFLCISFTNLQCKKEAETISADSIKADSIIKPDKKIKPVEKTEALYLFIGTYSGSNSKGIYVYEMDPVSGNLSYKSSLQSSNPSYLCIHPNKKWVYAVNETDNGNVISCVFDTTKKSLTRLNSVSAGGKAPCFISIDESGKYVMVANYTSGNIVLFPINEDGSLAEASSVIQHSGKSIHASRQEGPHAHMISQELAYIYVADLGIDKIMRYSIDASNSKFIDVGSTDIITGSGPRHFVRHPKLNNLYLLCELKGTIEAFNINQSNGSLTRFQIISNMKEGDHRYAGSADIHITPNGKFLYASNRGDVNTLGMYAINQSSGELSFAGFQDVKGKTPRNFVITPDGKFLLVANQDSGNIIVFEINSDGTLKDIEIEIKVPNPVCLKFR